MKKKKVMYVIIILLLVVAASCGFFFAREYMTAREEIFEYTAMQDEYTSVGVEPVSDFSDDSLPTETAGLSYVTVDFNALLHTNPETVGWVAIPDSVISYPVVQTKDNAKYLNTSFQGKRSSVGTPFADKDNNMWDLDANTILYGHNMGAGRQDMFGSLLSYKDYEYYMAHRYIQFDTIYQQHSWWKVFAVIGHDIRSDKFNYLSIQFNSADDFTDWIATAKELSIHDADMDISPHERILTLSTCDRSRYGRNGRLLILAVEMNAEASYINER